MRNILSTSIEEFFKISNGRSKDGDIASRTYHTFYNNNAKTVRDIIKFTPGELMLKENFGSKSLIYLIERLSEYNLRLFSTKMETTEETFTITMEKDHITHLIDEVAEIVEVGNAIIKGGQSTPKLIADMKLWVEFGEKLLEATSNED